MLEYNMDISPASYSLIYTPNSAVKAFPFNISELGYFQAGPQYFTRRDGFQPVLLIYTIGGQGEMHWKGQSCALTPGTAVVISCDSFHEYRTVGDSWQFHWAHLGGTGLDGYRAPLLDRLTPVQLVNPSALEEQFRSLKSLDSNGGILALAEISHIVSGLLLTMLRSLSDPAGDSAMCRAEVRKLADYIQQNLEKPLSIEDFTQVTNLSKYHLIHLFHQQMGVPPYRYLHHCRANRAQQLLRATDLPVSEIGQQVGYTDPVNFIRHFRAITGTTPAKYRRESMQLP